MIVNKSIITFPLYMCSVEVFFFPTLTLCCLIKQYVCYYGVKVSSGFNHSLIMMKVIIRISFMRKLVTLLFNWTDSWMHLMPWLWQAIKGQFHQNISNWTFGTFPNFKVLFISDSLTFGPYQALTRSS